MYSSDATTRNGLPRLFDCLLAVAVLALTCPLLLMTAVLVASSSRGPILFRQQRIGRNGRPFTLIKFRTMETSHGRRGPGFTARDDPRVTKVGRFLRRTKLDELPELINILRGDMSWVGPRPEVPRYVDLDDPGWQQVLNVRPGITDPVTLRFRNEDELLASVEEDRDAFYRGKVIPFKLRGYLEYQSTRSPGSDLAVLLRTVVAILIPGSTRAPSAAELRATSESAN